MKPFGIKLEGSEVCYKQIILLFETKSSYAKWVEIVMVLFKNIHSYWMHNEKNFKHISWKIDRSISPYIA